MGWEEWGARTHATRRGAPGFVSVGVGRTRATRGLLYFSAVLHCSGQAPSLHGPLAWSSSRSPFSPRTWPLEQARHHHALTGSTAVKERSLFLTVSRVVVLQSKNSQDKGRDGGFWLFPCGQRWLRAHGRTQPAPGGRESQSAPHPGTVRARKPGDCACDKRGHANGWRAGAARNIFYYSISF